MITMEYIHPVDFLRSAMLRAQQAGRDPARSWALELLPTLVFAKSQG